MAGRKIEWNKIVRICLFFIFINGVVKAQTLPWSERMAATAMSNWPNSGWQFSWNYEQGFVMRSITSVYEKYKNPNYLAYVQKKIDASVNGNGSISYYSPTGYNLDDVLPGRSVLFLYKNLSLNKYKIAADLVRSQLKTHPRVAEGGFWHKNIYHNQMWLDGLYMAEPFYAEYSLMFDQPENFDDIANQLLLMNKKAIDPVTGLLYHGWDAKRSEKWANPVTGCSSQFWGRALGWYAMSIVDVLDYFPVDHPKRDSIVGVLKNLSTALLRYQDAQTGLWYQVVDQGDKVGNYLESSASCMFVYTIAKAVRKGYIDTSNIVKVEKAYEGILKTFVSEDNAGTVHLNGTCTATGLGGTPYRDGSYEYYINVTDVQDDARGIAAFILASIEMEYLLLAPLDLKTYSQTESHEIEVYPNPVRDVLYVSNVDESATGITVFDSIGKLCYVGTGNMVPIHNLMEGIYVLHVQTGSKMTSLKFYKK